MTADPGATPSAAPRKPQPGEQFFEQSIADLARRLGERADNPAISAVAAAEARRRAMQAYDVERMRRLRLVLTGAGAFVATATLVWFVVLIGQPEAPAAASPVAEATPVPSPPPTIVAAVEASAPATPAAAPVVEAPPPPEPLQVAVLSRDPPLQPAAAPAPVAPSPLGRDEIREVQKRLRGFGFNPGAIDGVAGRQTEIATQHYLEARGQAQLPPSDPQLLDQLRHDPAPAVSQVVQRANGSSAGPGASQPARRSFDPFQPVKVAGAEVTRFLQSVFR
jgi:hypothetical protein